MARTGERRKWQRDELLAVLNLYCRTPFGKLHQRNPEIVSLAEKLGRTPSSIAMKASNFASLDPALAARGIRGLEGASRQDQAIWDELRSNSENLAAEAEEAYERLQEIPPETPPPIAPVGPTDRVALVRVRRVQRFFRRSVLVAYGGACAVCDFNIEGMLIASHIIGWAANEQRRADPTNGMLLCSLHDRAFDGAFMTFDASLRVVLSPQLGVARNTALHEPAFLRFEGRTVRTPEKFAPDPEALEHHRRVTCRSWYGRG